MSNALNKEKQNKRKIINSKPSNLSWDKYKWAAKVNAFLAITYAYRLGSLTIDSRIQNKR